MLTIIYRAIVLMVALLVGYNLFSEEKMTMQLNAAIVLIPLVLRFLMIK